MADRVGTYLSDENCRRRCVNQTPPMSICYTRHKYKSYATATTKSSKINVAISKG